MLLFYGNDSIFYESRTTNLHLIKIITNSTSTTYTTGLGCTYNDNLH